jgi:hypothetical protein
MEMGIRYRMALAAGFVGAVAVAATAFGQTGGATPSPSDHPNRPGHKMGRRNLVHSESKVQVDGGFALVIVDRGEVTAVSGRTVTIKRADGESVSATAGDDTKVRRNGEDAQVSTLKAGDRGEIVQVERDGARTVRAIRAFSKDFQPKDHPRRGPMRQRRPGHSPDVPASDAAVDPAVFAV